MKNPFRKFDVISSEKEHSTLTVVWRFTTFGKIWLFIKALSEIRFKIQWKKH